MKHVRFPLQNQWFCNFVAIRSFAKRSSAIENVPQNHWKNGAFPMTDALRLSDFMCQTVSHISKYVAKPMENQTFRMAETFQLCDFMLQTVSIFENMLQNQLKTVHSG